MDLPAIDLRSEWDADFDSFLAQRVYEFNSRVTGLFDGKPVVGSIKDRFGASHCGCHGPHLGRDVSGDVPLDG